MHLIELAIMIDPNVDPPRLEIPPHPHSRAMLQAGPLGLIFDSEEAMRLWIDQLAREAVRTRLPHHE